MSLDLRRTGALTVEPNGSLASVIWKRKFRHKHVVEKYVIVYAKVVFSFTLEYTCKMMGGLHGLRNCGAEAEVRQHSASFGLFCL